MHGLIFETSICYWQDQPDKKRTRLLSRVCYTYIDPFTRLHTLLFGGLEGPKDVQPRD